MPRLTQFLMLPALIGALAAGSAAAADLTIGIGADVTAMDPH